MSVNAPTREITVRYFAWLREKTGISEERVMVPDSIATVADLVELLRARGPEFDAAFALCLERQSLHLGGQGRQAGRSARGLDPHDRHDDASPWCGRFWMTGRSWSIMRTGAMTGAFI